MAWRIVRAISRLKLAVRMVCVRWVGVVVAVEFLARLMLSARFRRLSSGVMDIMCFVVRNVVTSALNHPLSMSCCVSLFIVW